MALAKTLAIAGIKRGKGSFLGLFFLMSLTAAVLTFAVSFYVDLNARQVQALAEAGAGDVYAKDLAVNLTDEVVTDIEALPEVGEVRVHEAVAASTSYVDGEGASIDKNPTSSVLYAAWGSGIDFKLFAPDGRSYAREQRAPGSDEVYVPLSLSVSPGIKAGDRVCVSAGGGERTLVVAGFVEDPQMGTAFMESNRYLVAPETLDVLLRDVEAFERASDDGSASVFDKSSQTYRAREIDVFMTDAARNAGATPIDLTRAIAEGTSWGSAAPAIFSSSTLMGYSMMVVVIGSAFMAAFACLLFVVALVICTHTISSSIEERYADYGTMKALGIPQCTIAGVLVGEYAVVTLAGFAAGFALGSALAPIALPLFAPITGVLATSNRAPFEAAALLAALLAFVAAAVAFKTRKLARISPLSAIRGGTGDVSFASRAARTVTGRCLGLQLALRGVVSAKRRYVGLVACSLLLCAFVALVLGIGQTLNKPGATYDVFGMWSGDVSAAIKSPDVDASEVDEAIASASPIEKSWREAFTMINYDGESRAFVGLTDVSVVKGVAEGRAPQHDNEVLVGANLAAEMGLGVGDELQAEGTDGKTRTYIVCGTLASMLNAGYGCILTFDAVCDLKGMDPAEENAAYQYKLADPGKGDQARDLLEERFGSDVDASPSGLFEDTGDMIKLIQSIFIGMAYAMAAVAVLLVFLSVSLIIGRLFSAERHDLGVYRALGFTAASLRAQFALRFFFVSLIGCALGATAAMLGGGWLMSRLFGLFGLTRFSLDVSPVLVVGLTLGLSLVFLVAAYASACKVKRVDVRELVAE